MFGLVSVLRVCPLITRGSFSYTRRFCCWCPVSTCLWIASKFEDLDPPSVVEILQFGIAGRPTGFSRADLCDMEREVGVALGYRFMVVTSVKFAREFLAICNNSASTIWRANPPILCHMVHYLLNMSRLNEALVGATPSLMAAASICLARATVGPFRNSHDQLGDAAWTMELQNCTGYGLADMIDTMRIMRLQHERSETYCVVTEGPFSQFNKETHLFVSTKTVLPTEELERLFAVACIADDNQPADESISDVYDQLTGEHIIVENISDQSNTTSETTPPPAKRARRAHVGAKHNRRCHESG